MLSNFSFAPVEAYKRLCRITRKWRYPVIDFEWHRGVYLAPVRENFVINFIYGIQKFRYLS